MANYINEKCIVCSQAFKSGDDIVVCPECGTPYHRQCYSKAGKCINTELHMSKKSWYQEKREHDESERKKAQQQAEENAAENVCPKCGFINSPGSSFCVGCGENIGDEKNAGKGQEQNWNQAQQRQQGGGQNSYTYMNFGGENVKIDFNDPYAGMNPELEFEGGAKLGNVAEFIGSNRLMLLILFRKFKTKMSKISTNLACLFFPELYFAYRKMWKMFFVVTGILLAFSIPSIIYTFTFGLADEDLINELSAYSSGDSSGYTQMMVTMLEKLGILKNYLEPHEVLINNLAVILNWVTYAFKLILFFFANYFYYRYTLKKVAGIQKFASLDRVTYECQEAGGTKAINIVWGLLIKWGLSFVLTCIVLGIAAAIVM